MNAERKNQLEENQKRQAEESRVYYAKKFGIPLDEVIGASGGCCYGTIWVKTRAIAEKVAAAVKDGHVNGGMFHGMKLGGITDNGKGVFTVMI